MEISIHEAIRQHIASCKAEVDVAMNSSFASPFEIRALLEDLEQAKQMLESPELFLNYQRAQFRHSSI